ncbi:MAG: lysophospholipid acyltransferase family protein [Candidatus Omnitrophica bacterium]|nr:lysophospholipid acyltransferase family protein [Candidatus Omnitrophota bacterium]
MKFDRKMFQPFLRSFARQGLIFLVWIFKVGPYWLVHGVARALLRFALLFMGKQGKVAIDSLQVAFGKEKTLEELKQILRRCGDTFIEDAIELLYFLAHPEKARDYVTFEGKENLDAALKKGNGVIALTAHYGNFPLMMLGAVQMGYPTNCVIKPARDTKMSDYLLKKREKIGLKTIFTNPRNQCAGQCIKALRNNEIIFLLADQNFGAKGGVFVEFFGQKAGTATGPVVFAQRTGAAIVPMFAVRQSDGKHKIFIEPEYKLEHDDDEQKMFEVNMGNITKIIENYIRKYPHEWAWMHRRWKSRPPEEEKDVTV